MNSKRSSIVIALFLAIGLFLGGTNIAEAAVKVKPVFEIVSVDFVYVEPASNRIRVTFMWENLKAYGYEASIRSETEEVFYMLNTRAELWPSAYVTVGTNSDYPIDETGTYTIRVAPIDRFGNVIKRYIRITTFEITDLNPLP